MCVPSQVPIGAISETVTVEAVASMINTTNAAVSKVVDQTYAAEWSQLSGFDFGRMWGAAGGLNATTYAGARGSLAASTALGTTQALVSLDVL